MRLHVGIILKTYHYVRSANGLRNLRDKCYDPDGYPSKYTEFTCKATNKKLYHNKVLRYRKELRNSIINRCDRKMPNINEGCPYFSKI